MNCAGTSGGTLAGVRLSRLGGGFLAGLAVSVAVVGTLAEAQVRWRAAWPAGDWLLLRAGVVAVVYVLSAAATDWRLVRAADWPVLRLTGQGGRLWLGLFGPCAAGATLVWAAGVPVSMRLAWRTGWPEWAAAEGLALPVGLAAGLAGHLGFWALRTWTWLGSVVGLAVPAAMLLPLAFGGTPATVPGLVRGVFHKAVVYPWWAGGMAVAAAALSSGSSLAWLGRADERFAADYLAVQPKRPRGTRRSRPLRTGRPVRERIVRDARRPVWLTAAMVIAGMGLLFGVLMVLMGPAGAATMRTAALRLATVLCGLAAAAVAGLTPLVCAETALTQRWFADVALTRPLRATLAEVRSAAWRAAWLPLAGLAGFGAAYGFVEEDRGTLVIVFASVAGVLLLGWVAQFGFLSLSLGQRRDVTRGVWSVLCFALPPVVLPYLALGYRNAVRRAEAEPASIEREASVAVKA